MNSNERTRIARKRLYLYQEMQLAVREHYLSAFGSSKGESVHGIQTSRISDPTADGAIALTVLPRHIREKKEWIDAIDEARAECEETDKSMGIENGLAYVMDNQFCLKDAMRPRKKNIVAKLRIMKDCNIAERTYYNWLKQITDSVVYFATRKGLL